MRGEGLETAANDDLGVGTTMGQPPQPQHMEVTVLSKLRSRLTYGNVVATLALFVALGGTAAASVIVSSNSQVAQNTISGHKPPSGDHPNVIAGSVSGQDLASGAVSGPKLA